MTLSHELQQKISVEKDELKEKKAKSWAVILDITKREVLKKKGESGSQEITGCDTILSHIMNIHSIIHEIKLLDYLMHRITSFNPTKESNKKLYREFKVRKK